VIFIALVIGALLTVAAIRDTHADLFTALAVDVPAFATWGAAIIALGAIGFIPNLKPASRALVALILVVLVLRNYQAVINGLTSGLKSVESGAGSSDGSKASGAGTNKKRGNVWVSDANASSMLANASASFNMFSA
jgi:hypothetical protein